MTYGWAILIVLIAIAALAYYGVLRPDRYLPNTCILEVGLNCVGFNVETSKTTLVIQNSFGGAITIDKVAVSKKDGSSCSNTESTTLGNNEKATFILLDCDNGDSREQFEGEINITYTKEESTLTHVTKGRMVARITAGAGGGSGGNGSGDGDGDGGGDGGGNIGGTIFLQSDYTGDNTCISTFMHSPERWCFNVTFTDSSNQIAINITTGSESIDTGIIQLCEDSSPTGNKCNCVDGTVINITFDGTKDVSIPATANAISDTMSYSVDTTTKYWLRMGSTTANRFGFCSYDGPTGSKLGFQAPDIVDFGEVDWESTFGGTRSYFLLWNVIGDGGGDGSDGGNETITCSIDSDCGTDGFVGSYYCINNSVTQNQLNYICLNPGIVNSSCIVSNSSVALDYCDPILNQVCVEGNSTCGMNETATICTDPGGCWVTKTPMPTGRVAAAGIGFNGKFYVIEGSQPGFQGSTITEVYDPITDSWSTLALSKFSRDGSAAGQINGKLYVVGGHIGYGSDTNALEVYDPINDDWTTLTPMSTVRHHPTAGVINGKLYVAGGNTPSSILNSLEVYDPEFNSWTTLAPMATARANPMGVVINTKEFNS